ncbi:MAG: 1-acyl-sn-glycerol-3-phosphate acyltransferase [Chloroflexi bacterium]|nr:1-acyl-sn-glycerol-3-phosphate acyltransferase [Chloroflexota bacterium]
MNAGKASLVTRLGRLSLRLFLRSLFRVQVEGAERIPRQGGYILVANHLNWVDPILLAATFPLEPRIYFLAPGDVVLNRWWKTLLMRIFGGAIFYRRSSGIMAREVVKNIVQVLRDGGILGIFPEGRLGDKEGELLPLRRGVGHFALDSGAPLLPVALSGTRELYLGKKLQLRIGELLWPEPGADAFGAKVGEVVAQVGGALRSLVEPYIDPPGVVKRWRWLTHLL